MYDHGIIAHQDDTELGFCKGECDASYDAESYSLAFIIWRGDEIIYSKIFRIPYISGLREYIIYSLPQCASKA